MIINSHLFYCLFSLSTSDPLTVSVAGVPVQCSPSLKSLGVIIDSHLSLEARVNSIISDCNYHLRAFRYIRPSLSAELAAEVGGAIILSRLDFCNSLLAGLPQSGIDLLQHIQNQVVRVVKQLPWRAHITPARTSLH